MLEVSCYVAAWRRKRTHTLGNWCAWTSIWSLLYTPNMAAWFYAKFSDVTASDVYPLLCPEGRDAVSCWRVSLQDRKDQQLHWFWSHWESSGDFFVREWVSSEYNLTPHAPDTISVISEAQNVQFYMCSCAVVESDLCSQKCWYWVSGSMIFALLTQH